MSEYCILYLYEDELCHKRAAATMNVNSVFRQNTVNEQTVWFWFQRFASSDFSLGIQEKTLPKASINDADLKAIKENN